MHTFKNFEEVLYTVNENTFDDIALRLFRYQAVNNPVYSDYLKYLGINSTSVSSLAQIPFLPISFFKSHTVATGIWPEEAVFSSSGTTGSLTSRHLVQSLAFYQSHSEGIFEQFFGPLYDFHILALLPSYLEREGSSLIYMVDHFIKRSKSPHSGFYLNDLDALLKKIGIIKGSGRKVLLLGVSFALLDLAEKHEVDLSHCIVMETGGMKGRRKELVREELHGILSQRLNVPVIHSEYGMTELLSQGYSFGNGIFQLPEYMKIMLRDVNDPFTWAKTGKTGMINVIDLANFHSCAFIETQDLGRTREDGNFEILGRADNSDARGCNLLVG